jgi:5-methylcytosine-specific restriction enzyme subunit McrC
MSKDVVILEYGRLWHGEGGNISKAAFDFLKNETLRGATGKNGILTLGSKNGKESLSVQNYVGVLSTPDGTVIEILPKHSEDIVDVAHSRKLLLKMLSAVYGLPWKQSREASLSTRSAQLPDILIQQFLGSVGKLVRTGLKSDYIRCKETSKYLRGRLNVSRQIRLPATKKTVFCVEYDKYCVDRPENRLIKQAFNTILKWRLSPNNKRVAKELLLSFAEVESSQDVLTDFKSWRTQRDMIHYGPILPWLQLILRELSPWAFSGSWNGVSMLFPMEELFELYVYQMLKRQTIPGFTTMSQAKSQYLATHLDKPMFQLRPDILVREGLQNICVLDTKWKLLHQNSSDTRSKYGLSQADFYQMFAYGHKYLRGRGKMLLIYPRHSNFQLSLPPFFLEGELELWAVPYDLETDELITPASLELPFFKPQIILTQAA